jgi:hypothetical protein
VRPDQTTDTLSTIYVPFDKVHLPLEQPTAKTDSLRGTVEEFGTDPTQALARLPGVLVAQFLLGMYAK